jgi:hypothetical protein
LCTLQDRWHVELLLPCRVVQRDSLELSDITPSVLDVLGVLRDKSVLSSIVETCSPE